MSKDFYQKIEDGLVKIDINAKTLEGKSFSDISTLINNEINKIKNGTYTSGNASKLNNQLPSYYLNYNNLSNKPTVPTKVSQLTNDSGFITSSSTIYEARLAWGGKNFSGSYGPIDAAMIPDLGANRLAFAKHAGITVEYSRDGGVTWLDYGATEQQTNALTSSGTTLVIGKADNNNKATDQYMLRINLYTSVAQVYTALNKFAIYLSTNGSQGSYCTIRARTQTNYLNNVDTWVVRADKVPVSGWSGWNIINISSLITYGNSADSQFGHIQFIFGCTGRTGNYNGLQISRLFGFGGVGWTTPSNLARYGTMYSYDSSQNVTFPAQVRATAFNENGTLLANKYASLTNYNTLNSKVTTLIGSDSSKSVRTIASEEASKAVATVVNNAPSAFDTLKEISDWIGTHSDDAMRMDLQITANQNAISALTPRVTQLESDYSTLNGNVTGLQQNMTSALGDVSTLKTTVKNIQDGVTAVGNSSKLNGQNAAYYLDYTHLTNKPTIPSLSGYLKETTADSKYLAKTTYEYSKELSFGSTGKLLIGKFPCYDTNISIAIKSTTNTTYYGVLIIATQNINTSGGGKIVANVYGDATNTIAPNIYIEYLNNSRYIAVYFSPSSWSKNLIHIQSIGLQAVPTNLMENVAAIPSTATLKPTNALTSTFLKTGDIASWAKATNKPSYAFSEITSKPTTIAGYEITDCQIVNGVITIGNQNITPLTSTNVDNSGTWNEATSSKIPTKESVATWVNNNYQAKGNYVTTNTAQDISGIKTFIAPANTSGTEQTTTKLKTSNGGAIIFGKEGPNSGTMIRLDQVDGTCRLRFRASATAGAMVWEQPESGAVLYFDLGAGSNKRRISMPASAGTLALTSQIPSVNNGKIIINQAGTKKGEFTLNQSGDVTIELTDNNTTYSVATTTTNGLMASADKSHLDSMWSVWEADGNNDTLVNKVKEVLAVFDSYPEGTTIVNALANKQDKGNYISYTLATANVVGTNKQVAKTNPTTLYVPSGLIMGGTAAAAGLVTRGLCGVTTPDENGACTKENLYVNYDGDNTYRSTRQLVLQAGAIGTHYGNNLYQFCAARGDAVKAYCDAHYGALSTVNSNTTKISNLETNYDVLDANLSDLQQIVNSHTESIATIPTKTSQLENDSGYLTAHQSLANYVTINGTQTITGLKTINNNIIITGMSSSSASSKMIKFGTSSTTYAGVTANTSNQLVFNAGGTNIILVGANVLRPLSGQTNVSLGDTTQAWNNLYLNGKIYKGSYNYTLPSKTGTIALTSNIPNTASNINSQYDEQDVTTAKFVEDYVKANVGSKNTVTIFNTVTTLDTTGTTVGTFKTKSITLSEAVTVGDKLKVYFSSNSSSYGAYGCTIIEFELFEPYSGQIAGSGMGMPTSGDQKFIVSASIADTTEKETKTLTITTYTLSATGGAPSGVNNISITKVERIR